MNTSLIGEGKKTALFLQIKKKKNNYKRKSYIFLKMPKQVI